MSMPVSERNNAIDILRYICAILVVTIHTEPFREEYYEVYYVLTQFAARIGVPFFFAVSGYYFFEKLAKGTLDYFEYFSGIMKKYLIWSILYFAVDFMEGGYHDIPNFIKNSILFFAIYGSYYHFWFFPALLFASFTAYIMYRIGLRKSMVFLTLILYFIGCMGCAYSGLFEGIPGLKNLFASDLFHLLRKIVLTGLPYFVCGYLVWIVRNNPPKYLSGGACKWTLMGTFMLWIGEFLILHLTNWNGRMSISLMMYPVVTTLILTMLHYPMVRCRRLSEKCRILAGFTYYAHPMVILFLEKWNVQNHFPSICDTSLFLLTILITFACGIFIWKCRNQYLLDLAI